MTWRSIVLALATALTFLVPALPATAATAPIGSLQDARAGHSATRLWGGSILVVGGGPRRAELVDPATGRVRFAGTLPFGLSGHTTIALPHRRALVVGGSARGVGREDCGRFPALLWHGATKRFTRVGALPDVVGASATKLLDGRILIAGGGTRCTHGRLVHSGTRRAVLYDPATGRATPTGSLITARERHLALRLADGRVLVAGGMACSYGSDVIGCTILAAAEVYDPATGSWQRTGALPDLLAPRLSRLRDGTVVLSGSVRAGGAQTLWRWDPASGAFVPATAQRHAIPAGHVPVVLAGGRLALVGGDRGDGSGYRAVQRLRTWAARSDRWTLGPRPGPAVVGGHTATRVGSDIILIGGRVVRPDGRLRAISRITRWRPGQAPAPTR